MSGEFFSSRIVKTRKRHQCACCCRMIPKGFRAVFHQGKCDGEFYSYYLCNTCETLTDKYPEYVIDEWEGWISNDVLQEYLGYLNLKRPLQLLNKLEEESGREKADIAGKSSCAGESRK